MVTIDATYEGSLRCTATHEPSGTALSTDAPKDNQGLGASFSPTDLVATALGSCAMTTMAMVGNREGIDLSGMTARMVKAMAADPRRVAAVPIEITMPCGLEGEVRERIENAGRRCPVARSLHPDVDQTMTFVYPG